MLPGHRPRSPARRAHPKMNHARLDPLPNRKVREQRTSQGLGADYISTGQMSIWGAEGSQAELRRATHAKAKEVDKCLLF